VRVSFEENFDACVSSILDITVKTVLDCNAIDEGAKADALYDACGVDFYAHYSRLCLLKCSFAFQ